MSINSDNPVNMYDPTREYYGHKNDIDEAIQTVLNHGKFINGPQVKELEDKLANYVGTKHCIGVANGTDALQIALMALDVGPGDEVITVAHTWISCAEVITLLGAKPVFVDIEDVTFNMDPVKLEEKINDHTKAILVVNLYGHLANYDAIKQISLNHCIPIIEDAAQSFGAIQRGKRSCSFGNISTTSFFPTKPLGCYGDGGACFTDSDDLGYKIRAIRNHGAVKKFYNEYIGVNSRLDTIQASILLAKFNYFQETLDNRNFTAALYTMNLRELEEAEKISLPTVQEKNYHAWAQYSIILNSKEERDQLNTLLKENGVNTSIFYPKPLHYQKCFEYLGMKDGDLPVTERVCDTVLSVPCYGEFRKEEIEYVCNVIKSYFNN